MFKFTIRELLLVTTIAALVLGWWIQQWNLGDPENAVFEQDLQFLNGGGAHGLVDAMGNDGVGIATTRTAADEVAARFGERFPIGTWGRLAVSAKGLGAIVVDAARRKSPPQFSRNDDILIVFATWREDPAHHSDFEIVGFQEVVRRDHTLAITALCRLAPKPGGSELGTGICLVAARATSHSTKDWPAGTYQCRMELCPIDDIYLRQAADELLPLSTASRIGKPIAFTFTLTD